MKKIISILKECFTTADKLQHMMVNIITTLLFCFITPLGAGFMSFWIWILKEIVYDGMMKKGVFDWKDLLANFIGCVIGTIILYYMILINVISYTY